MSQKQVMPKSEDLRRSLEKYAIWTFDTKFPTIFNKSCTYITFKSAVKHRQLGYGNISIIGQARVFPTLGQTIKDNLLSKVQACDTYSLLIDDFSDIAVSE